MYRKHFALTRFPFEAELAPEELFACTAMAEAGSGKTTVCRKVTATLHPGLYRRF